MVSVPDGQLLYACHHSYCVTTSGPAPAGAVPTLFRRPAVMDSPSPQRRRQLRHPQVRRVI